jgi:arylsulfatase A
MKLTGTAMPSDRIYDGFDMSGILFGNGTNLRHVMFYYNGSELYAARKGPFKAHYITWAGYSKQPPEKHDVPVLYNLEADPGERFNVSTNHPDVIADIQREVEKHRAGVVPATRQY